MLRRENTVEEHANETVQPDSMERRTPVADLRIRLFRSCGEARKIGQL